MAKKTYAAEVTHYCAGSMFEHEYDEELEVESDALMAWLNCPRCGAETEVELPIDNEPAECYENGFSYHIERVTD